MAFECYDIEGIESGWCGTAIMNCIQYVVIHKTIPRVVQNINWGNLANVSGTAGTAGTSSTTTVLRASYAWIG